jgi:hypothetical protein
MAGDWIPWSKGLPKKLEVLRIARLTGRDRRLVACLLMEFWEWADDQTEDGFLSGMDVRNLSALHADTDDAFWSAVIDSGWLAPADGGLMVPNFCFWMGRSAKRRLKDTKRKGQSRGGVTGKTVRKMSASDADKNGLQDRTVLEEASASSAAEPRKGKARGKRDPQPRRRDDLFDAVAEVTASDPKASGSHIGRVCSCLREADPPYTPAEVRALATALRARGFTLPLTLGTVEKYIGWTRQPGAPPGESDAERDARMAREREDFERLRREVEAGGGPRAVRDLFGRKRGDGCTPGTGTGTDF